MWAYLVVSQILTQILLNMMLQSGLNNNYANPGNLSVNERRYVCGTIDAIITWQSVVQQCSKETPCVEYFEEGNFPFQLPSLSACQRLYCPLEITSSLAWILELRHMLFYTPLSTTVWDSQFTFQSLDSSCMYESLKFKVKWRSMKHFLRGRAYFCCFSRFTLLYVYSQNVFVHSVMFNTKNVSLKHDNILIHFRIMFCLSYFFFH